MTANATEYENDITSHANGLNIQLRQRNCGNGRTDLNLKSSR